MREQEKTINFQKAKIIALQTELEDAVKQEGRQDGRFEEIDAQNKRYAEELKKTTDKLNQATAAQQKLKSVNTDLLQRIGQLEKTVQDQSKELDAGEREKRK